MELRQLRYFLAVARKSNFTHAAEELFIAQPALSQQIHALERELGIALFERTSRRVHLTAAGSALRVYAERILLEAEHARTEMESFADLTRGRVAIGVLQSLCVYRLPALLARFHAQYKGIEMVLHEDVTQSLLEQLKSRQLDLAIIHKIADIFPLDVDESQTATESILTEEIVLVVAPHHPLAQKPGIAPEELQNERFIVFKPGSGLRQALTYISTLGKFMPRMLVESGDIATIRSLTAEGLGVSVLPLSVAVAHSKELIMIPLQPPLPPRTVMVVWHKQLPSSRAATAFLNFLREDIRRYPWSGQNVLPTS